MTDLLLEARDLTKHYPVTKGFLQRTIGYVRAIDGISFTIEKGKTLSLAGESGAGKTTASWGSMVGDGRNELDRTWWISAFPGIAIGLVVMSGNFLGDWIRDKMNPRLRQL